jgi:GH24 family phage-related lysozyme (muramidase)
MKLYTGCVENRQDPLKLGRCQVRVVGLHNYDKTQLKTEDLPWAYPMQPITSAAMSGIGHSPIGLVEGTWVVLTFRDDDEQQPIILGSLGGIPQQQGTIDYDDDNMILKEDGYLPGSNQQTTTTASGETSTNTDSQTSEETSGLNPASSYTPSEDAIALIKQYEGLKLTAYQDTGGVWTIGYGTTSINGVPVYEGQTITEAQAEEYLTSYLQTTAAPSINSKTKAPITQSMYDALCCFTYNLGSGNFSKSTLLKELNAGKYLDAATLFSDWTKDNGVVQSGLVKRRVSEKDLFLKNGVPSISGDLTPAASNTTPVDSNSSSGLNTTSSKAVSLGFRDPKGKYPLYLNEPDTNKLARHEDIKKTIVRKKELAREKGVISAFNVSWDQSPIPYNSVYPYNQVFMSESGHVMEFDDTPNSERVHIYHKSGTYTEIDSNGTEVKRIVGDKYEILERNGHLYVKGSVDVTIDGNHNVKINNALNVEVIGNVKMNVTGNMDVDVAGTYNLKAKGINIETSTNPVNVLSGNSVNVQSAAAQSFKAGATFNVDAVRVDMNSGTAGNATATGLDTLTIATPELPTFAELVVLTRGAEAAAHYETPEEGDATDYTAKQIADGTLDPDDKDYGTSQGTASARANNVTPLPQSCNIINSMEKFNPDLILSPHFSLGGLTKGGSRMPVNQMGLTAQEIVCNLKGLAENCLEPIINLYPGMVVTSGFRRPGDVAKSSATSQHYLGQAADIIIPGFNREKHYEAIQAIQQIIPYDQLILEYSGKTVVWIHVSFKYTANRQLALTMRDHTKVGDTGQFTLIG